MADLSQFHHLDILLFAVLPYLAMVIFFLMTIYRYRQQSFTYSSLSSQFLENRRHFWGMVPFHYGILVVLAGHVIGFLVPRGVLWWNSHPARLYILEITPLTGGLLWVLPPRVRPPEQPAPDIALPAPPTDPSQHAVALLAYEEIARANVFAPDRSPPRARFTPGGPPAAPTRPASTVPSLRLYGLAVGPSGQVALIDADPTIPGAEIYRVGHEFQKSLSAWLSP